MPPTSENPRLRQIVEALPTAAYLCDPVGRITLFNRAAERLWGRTPVLNDDMNLYCGSHRLFALDGQPVPHENCWMAQAIAHCKPFTSRPILIGRPDGSRVEAEAHARPILGESGELLGGVNVLVDVSAQRRLGEQLVRLASDFERRVSERTAALETVIGDLRRSPGERPPLVPICSHCKDVRDAAGVWQTVETYLGERLGLRFTHGICPSCVRRHYGEFTGGPA